MPNSVCFNSLKSPNGIQLLRGEYFPVLYNDLNVKFLQNIKQSMTHLHAFMLMLSRSLSKQEKTENVRLQIPNYVLSVNKLYFGSCPVFGGFFKSDSLRTSLYLFLFQVLAFLHQSPKNQSLKCRVLFSVKQLIQNWPKYLYQRMLQTLV